MTLDKAIEILTEWNKKETTHSWNDMETARKLGIQALKRLKDTRKRTGAPYVDPLPSETKGD